MLWTSSFLLLSEPALVSLEMWKDAGVICFDAVGFDGAQAFGFFQLSGLGEPVQWDRAPLTDALLAGVGGSAARVVGELLVSGIFIVVSVAPVMDFLSCCGFHLWCISGYHVCLFWKNCILLDVLVGAAALWCALADDF
ncbi:hypothetical protein Nepgr_022948 [Nepenthes gracilis]|uniref:Uncharacterized protein n=1 Tax=Nepenthes gracilis TaxID=150966 RepID=A0AAD3XYW5_NEPGR|nr:hypothetical protein Nepgr_022948 [Nepenthes gracilis]